MRRTYSAMTTHLSGGDIRFERNPTQWVILRNHEERRERIASFLSESFLQDTSQVSAHKQGIGSERKERQRETHPLQREKTLHRGDASSRDRIGSYAYGHPPNTLLLLHHCSAHHRQWSSQRTPCRKEPKLARSPKCSSSSWTSRHQQEVVSAVKPSSCLHIERRIAYPTAAGWLAGLERSLSLYWVTKKV